jgi:thioredoxin reductase/polyferredoxin
MSRPILTDELESNIPGLFIAGDLAGAPVVKLAMEQGYGVAHRIMRQLGTPSRDPNEIDILIAGAGAAGLNAALEARQAGFRVVVLEKSRLASTIEDFPEGKWIYDEPVSRPPLGRLWLMETVKEQLLGRWQADAADLDVRTGEALIGLKRTGAGFEAASTRQTYRARRIILATGQRGNPRWLNVPGEDRPDVMHRLYSPRKYEGERILVIGGGNSAVEAALVLAERNHVTLSYRGTEFTRLFRDNARKLREARAQGRIDVVLQSNVTAFGDGAAELAVGPERRSVPFDHAFVLAGAEAPVAFLKSLGLKLEGEWTWQRWLWLAFSFAIAYTVYGVKLGAGQEFWPFRGWGYEAFSFFGRGWSFWYTVLYTLLVTIFGLQAMKRWGVDRKDKFQIWRFASLIGFQWAFFFLIPEFLFQWAVKYQWVGQQLASDPTFAGQAWRSYGLVYAWPLFFYTFFGGPHQVWIVWGALLSFVIIPLIVLLYGKRYCTWVCGCGGLAETLGDRWRHLAPKGKASIRWEAMNAVVLAAAALVTILMLGRDAVALFRRPADWGIVWYRLIVDTWLVGIIPVALYPFFGGKVWCRYWCPLAKMMELFSKIFTRLRWSRFAIHSNDKCIACGECTRYCQVGIDVMQFAMKQEELNNSNSSCIGCGICVTVCPMACSASVRWRRRQSWFRFKPGEARVDSCSDLKSYKRKAFRFLKISRAMSSSARILAGPTGSRPGNRVRENGRSLMPAARRT